MIDLGLRRIGALLQSTPPTWKSIHVGGTNGKGSICAYISAMLHASEVKVGRYNSPHMIDRWDCITVGDKIVDQNTFEVCEKVVKAKDEVHKIGATEFELLTATAFDLFNRHKIEMGVIEVGLGGRLDATNILENKVVTVISKIGLDHQGFLGNTIEEIAREKAGIMRPGVPCVLDVSNPPAVVGVIQDHATEIGTNVIFSPSESELRARLALSGFTKADMDEFQPHQKQNLGCAYTAFSIARYKTHSIMNIPTNSLAPAVKGISWPARLQLLDTRSITMRTEEVLLDGAHNAQSADVLGQFVDEKLREHSQTRVTWVLAASQGKELEGILKPLIKDNDCVAAVQFGPVDGMPWIEAMKPGDILAEVDKANIPSSRQYNAGTDISDALRWAVMVANNGPLVIAGSLYLASDVLRMLRNADRFQRALFTEFDWKTEDLAKIKQKRLRNAAYKNWRKGE